MVGGRERERERERERTERRNREEVEGGAADDRKATV